MQIKTIKENNLRYFNIYVVRVRKHDGEVYTYEMHLKEEEAEATANFCRENMSKLYTDAWVRPEIVWC